MKLVHSCLYQIILNHQIDWYFLWLEKLCYGDSTLKFFTQKRTGKFEWQKFWTWITGKYGSNLFCKDEPLVTLD